jgi:hypothetical protein
MPNASRTEHASSTTSVESNNATESTEAVDERAVMPAFHLRIDGEPIGRDDKDVG